LLLNQQIEAIFQGGFFVLYFSNLTKESHDI
jgi:hypothetical protein